MYFTHFFFNISDKRDATKTYLKLNKIGTCPKTTTCTTQSLPLREHSPYLLGHMHPFCGTVVNKKCGCILSFHRAYFRTIPTAINTVQGDTCQTWNITSLFNYVTIKTLTLPGPYAGVSGSLDSYCSLKPLCSGMGEVVPARTSPTLLPPSPRTVLSLSCFKVSQCINCRD